MLRQPFTSQALGFGDLKGHIQKAENALIQAIRLQPDLAEAHHRLKRVRAAQDDSGQRIQSAQHILHVLFRRE